MSKLDKDQVIEKFTQAYTSVNGKAPSLVAKGGWYSVDGGKNVRLAVLAEMTEALGKSATSEPKATTAPKSAAKAPAEKAPKPAAEKKAQPAAKKAKPSSKVFSVKSFCQYYVLSNLFCSRPPL